MSADYSAWSAEIDCRDGRRLLNVKSAVKSNLKS